MQLNPLALALSTAGGSRWSPLNLFFGGIQGLWYDLNDDSTIFQDSAGTTLASWGDPVGRVNDKSGRGNNAIQSTAGSRPIRGRMPKRGRVNLLAATRAIDNAYWTKSNSTVAAVATTAPNGATSVFKLVTNNAVGSGHIQRSISWAAGQNTLSIYAKASEWSWVRVGWAGGGTSFNLSAGTIGTIAAGDTPVIESLGDGWYRCSITRTLTATTDTYRVYSTNADNSFTTGDGVSGILIIDPQAELSATATAYQHVIDSLGFNVTETGQPSCGYLSFNGSNQWMQTAASVNFSATDEMSVFAGVRKVSDPVDAALVELNTPNWTSAAGSFILGAPITVGGTLRYYAFGSRGTAAAGTAVISNTTSASFIAPVYSVITGLADISADQNLLRANGAQVGSATGDQGSGNYGNYVAYFGARAGTSLFFNGLMFSTIIRGALTSGALLTRTEQYVARQTPTVNL